MANGSPKRTLLKVIFMKTDMHLQKKQNQGLQQVQDMPQPNEYSLILRIQTFELAHGVGQRTVNHDLRIVSER